MVIALLAVSLLAPTRYWIRYVDNFWGSDLLSQSGVTFYGAGEGDGASGDGCVVTGGDFAGGWAYPAWIWRD